MKKAGLVFAGIIALIVLSGWVLAENGNGMQQGQDSELDDDSENENSCEIGQIRNYNCSSGEIVSWCQCKGINNSEGVNSTRWTCINSPEAGCSLQTGQCVQNGTRCCMNQTCSEMEHSCGAGEKSKFRGCGLNCVSNWTCEKNKKSNMTQEQIKEQVREKNRIKFEAKTGVDCPDSCTCNGVVMKCMLEDGARQMTVYAQSGNVIVQSKGVNASTNVQLYKADNETLVGVFKGNKTKVVRVTPEQARNKINEKSRYMIENENITLDEKGYYLIQGNKQVKLFGMFKTKEKVAWEIDSETGEIIKIKGQWWGFMAKDVNNNQIAGASCGTVTPGYNDECCQSRGYDSWSWDRQECIFNS